MHLFLNGGLSGTPYVVPELSSTHHLRGGSHRKTPSRTREAFLGRRRHYSATVPRKKAGLHSPYLPKHAPCTCEMGDASDEMIQKRRTMGHVHGKAFRRQFDKGLHAKASTIEPSATHLNPKTIIKSDGYSENASYEGGAAYQNPSWKAKSHVRWPQHDKRRAPTSSRLRMCPGRR